MKLQEILKTNIFWISLLRVSSIFFLVMLVISLIMSSASDIFSGNWANVNEVNFSDGKWQVFLGFKLLFSVVYGIWVVVKKMSK